VKIVLVHPQIPQNTGSIVRLCAVTGNALILVPPMGFSTASRHLKRAGLDYWEGVDVQIATTTWEEELAQLTVPFYFFSSHAQRTYTDVAYTPNDYLIFGSETTGLPSHWHERWPDRFLTIPMQAGQRCLNLANSASIVVYEAWRQQGFSGSNPL
jgi:tRNA (cytidine/uridine-2'-O-)-methyltransferase